MEYSDCSVRIWRMRDGSSRKLADTNMSIIYDTAFSPDGRYVAAANVDGMLRIWDFRTGALLKRWKAKGPTHWLLSVVFTSDGLLSGGEDKTMRYWDVSSLTANQSSSRRDALGGGNMHEEKEIIAFRGHTVRDSCTCFSLEPICPLIARC
jgi:WD40 repeat protein